MTNTSERIVGLHTPGPWDISSDPWHYDTLSTVTAGDKRKVHPDRQMIVQVGGFADWREQEANTRLISAAPEMLEALQDLTQYMVWQMYGECRGFSSRLLDWPEAIAKANAALAKATGVQANTRIQRPGTGPLE